MQEHLSFSEGCRGVEGRDEALGDQGPHSIDGGERQLVLTQVNMVLHGKTHPLLPRVQPRASHYMLICVIIVHQNVQTVIVAPAVQGVRLLRCNIDRLEEIKA